MFDDPELGYRRRNNNKWDTRLLTEQTDYEILLPDEIDSCMDARIKQLYDQLYLDRYTPLNPQFSQALIARWRESNAFVFSGSVVPTAL